MFYTLGVLVGSLASVRGLRTTNRTVFVFLLADGSLFSMVSGLLFLNSSSSSQSRKEAVVCPCVDVGCGVDMAVDMAVVMVVGVMGSPLSVWGLRTTNRTVFVFLFADGSLLSTSKSLLSLL